ncbi:MAG: OB-fold domain-containing protein [Pseudomonadota bacterium]
MSGTPRPIADGLFTWPSESPRLIGSVCADCGCTEFPARDSCPACGSVRVGPQELPTHGTLWTWTVQRFLPKSPYNSGETLETFKPYGVGYIELPGAVRVEGRLTENDPDKLRIGMAMEVIFDVWTQDEEGNDLVTFAFRPVEDAA